MKVYCLITGWLLMARLCVAQPVRPLSIGDTVPPLAFTGVINAPDPTLSLDQPGATLTILAFVAAHCTSCYHTLAQLDSLRQRIPGLRPIAVTQSDPPEQLLYYLRRIPATRAVTELPVIVGDSLLHGYFPHRLISHLVWLDRDRRVLAITGSDYLKPDKVRAALRGQTSGWPVKQDAVDFDAAAGLFRYNTDLPVQPPFAYSAGLTGHLPGILPPSEIIRDSARRETRFTLYNKRLVDLAQLAATYQVVYQPRRLTLALQDPARFFPPPGMAISDWERDHTYCYSVTLPLSASDDELRQFIQADLPRWLRLLGLVLQPQPGPGGQPRFTLTQLTP